MTRLCVVGLGYIGLPTAALFAKAGLEVAGVDVNPSRVQEVEQGRSPFHEPGLDTLVFEMVKAGRLRAVSTLETADAFIIAVATPMDGDGKPDLQSLEAATRSVGRALRPGNLVVVESTVPPGTTLGLVRRVLELESKLIAGQDFHLAYGAERAIPGNTLHEMVHNDRLVGGIDTAATDAALALYAGVVLGTMLPTDALTAELAKLAENTYRSSNIGLANELAHICEEIGANVWEVIALANRHPRVQLHLPGPGVGGHCLPKDPLFLAQAVPEEARLIPLADRINKEQPSRVVERVLTSVDGARHHGKSKVALLGVAYRGGADDARESPTLPIARQLQEAGIIVAAHDPHVRECSLSLTSLEKTLGGADIAVLVTDHAEYREISPAWAGSLMRSRLILDTRNHLDHSSWRSHGFTVAVLGVGR